MTCEQLITDFLLDYVDGKLPLTTRLTFELHLKLCSACRNYLHNYRQTIQLARESALSPDIPTDDLPPDLIKAILKARQSDE